MQKSNVTTMWQHKAKYNLLHGMIIIWVEKFSKNSEGFFCIRLFASKIWRKLRSFDEKRLKQ